MWQYGACSTRFEAKRCLGLVLDSRSQLRAGSWLGVLQESGAGRGAVQSYILHPTSYIVGERGVARRCAEGDGKDVSPFTSSQHMPSAGSCITSNYSSVAHFTPALSLGLQRRHALAVALAQ